MRRELGVRAAATALAGVLLACGSACSGSHSSGSAGSTPPPRPPTASAPTSGGVAVPITAVLVQNGGHTLTTQALGGGCRRLTLQAQETSSAVHLTLTMTHPPGICPPYVLLVDVTTTLHTPLGHRALIDTTTGRPIQPRAR